MSNVVSSRSSTVASDSLSFAGKVRCLDGLLRLVFGGDMVGDIDFSSSPKLASASPSLAKVDWSEIDSDMIEYSLENRDCH